MLVAGGAKDEPGRVLDEASRAGRTVASFPAADEDYFHDMDDGIALTREEIQGRNTWIVWTGGNDRFWNRISIDSFGAFDLLKIISSHEKLEASRDNRWNFLGLVNEPCFENPEWENLSSNVGAQYFWGDRIFTWHGAKSENVKSNYMFQLLHASRPGSLDTSLVSTDYINNPRTMNAVYNLGPRLAMARRWGKETLAGGALNNSQFNDYVKEGPLTEFFQKPDTVWTPRILKDGRDPVGAL